MEKIKTESFFLIMDEQFFAKKDEILMNEETKMIVKKVYKRTWWTLLLDRFATYLKNKTRIVNDGITIEVKL